jgi:hypothetical protein
MTSETWLMIATNDTSTFISECTITEPKLIYRALTKWLIRGEASKLLQSYWEYLDQWDNELEEALLDQLLTQAESKPIDPQITNVRNRDYAIDITVLSKTVKNDLKTCNISSVLWVYFHSLKQKLRIEDSTINITLIKVNGKIESKLDKVIVSGLTKTPAPQYTGSKRVSKRSSISK